MPWKTESPGRPCVRGKPASTNRVVDKFFVNNFYSEDNIIIKIMCQHFVYTPLNESTLGQRETDSNNRMIMIRERTKHAWVGNGNLGFEKMRKI